MSRPGYGRLQVALHWLIALLLIVSFISHDGIKPVWRQVERGAGEVTASGGALLHIWVGVAILGLTLLRLGVRWTRGAPAAPASGPALLDLAGRLGHWALYALLLAIPASGALAWFGGFTKLGELHGMLFNIGRVMVALHTAAALFHQLVLKDNLLWRMLRPG